jgi:hypothetical protein
MDSGGGGTAEIIVMTSCQVINCVYMEFIFNISETISASIIRVDVIYYEL